jgi:hypothetical protein
MGTEHLGRLSLDAARAFENYRIGKKHVVVLMLFMALFDFAALGLILFHPDLARQALPVAVDETELIEVLEPLPDPAEPESRPEVEPEPELESEPETVFEEREPEDIRDPASREVLFTHYVQWGDTFYSLAARYWDREHLWPDLWLLNASNFPDPDLMVVGDVVSIYDPLGRPADNGQRVFSTSERERIFEAYLAVYRKYRDIGDYYLARADGRRSWYRTLGRNRINKAHWSVYSSLRYDPSLLDRYRSLLSRGDIEIIEEYVDRFGYPHSGRE